MATLSALKKEVTANLKADTGKEKLAITLNRACFRKTLSTTSGIGTQDLKPTYLELYTYLLVKYKEKLVIKPKSMDPKTFKICIYVK